MTLVRRATADGVSIGEVWRTFTASVADARTFLLTMLVMGPLVWGATLAINDAYDEAATGSTLGRPTHPSLEA